MKHAWLGILLGVFGVWALGCGSAPPQVSQTAAANEASLAWLGPAQDALAVRVRELVANVATEGYVPTDVHGRGFVVGGGHDVHALTVPAGSCYYVVGLGSSGIRDLDATLFSPDGETLAEDVEPDAHPGVFVCAEEGPRSVYHALRAYDGAGAYAFLAFTGPRDRFERVAALVGGRPGVAGDTVLEVESDSRLRDFSLGIARRGFEPSRAPTFIGLSAHQRVRVPLEVALGRCYTVVAFPRDGVTNVDLRILDELDAEIVTDVSATPEGAAQFCVDRDGEFAAELVAAQGSGGAVYETFEAPASTVGGASGLWLGIREETRLARSEVDQAVRDDVHVLSEEGWQEPRELARGQLVVAEAVAHEVTLGRAPCEAVVVSVGRGLGGTRVRVVDHAHRVLAEGAVSGGRNVVRVCGVSAGTVATLELVAQRGSGKYVLSSLSRHASLPVGVEPTLLGPQLDVEATAASAGFHEQARRRLEGGGQVDDWSIPAGQCALVGIATAPGHDVEARVEVDGRAVSAASGHRLTFRQCAPAEAGKALHVVVRGLAASEPVIVTQFVRSAQRAVDSAP